MVPADLSFPNTSHCDFAQIGVATLSRIVRAKVGLHSPSLIRKRKKKGVESSQPFSFSRVHSHFFFHQEEGPHSSPLCGGRVAFCPTSWMMLCIGLRQATLTALSCPNPVQSLLAAQKATGFLGNVKVRVVV